MIPSRNDPALRREILESCLPKVAMQPAPQRSRAHSKLTPSGLPQPEEEKFLHLFFHGQGAKLVDG